MLDIETIAVFFQSKAAPDVDGIKKPFKPGGYIDGGADIAFTLAQRSLKLVTPNLRPDPRQDGDWVFADSVAGLANAYEQGARVFWMNTSLHENHPLTTFDSPGVSLVGQDPLTVQRFADKFATNQMLAEHALPVATSQIIEATSFAAIESLTTFPLVVKPIRGRGSEGVTLVKNATALTTLAQKWIAKNLYGYSFMAEEFLPGTEVAITVMPPGDYNLGGSIIKKMQHWSLPPVRRSKHADGIAPYNGSLAVTSSSHTLQGNELSATPIVKILSACEIAAKLVGGKAPIRIDCRQNASGDYKIFDVNLKPGLLGPGRPKRDNQDNLCAIAARGIGWTYGDLLENMLRQAWPKPSL